jgi:hypothetical protein
MTQAYASGKRSIAFCDRCGRQCLYRELKKLTINSFLTSIKVCPDCWEPDQPQYQVAKLKITDPQGLYEPRPDPQNDEGTFVTVPVFALNTTLVLNSVTIVKG